MEFEADRYAVTSTEDESGSQMVLDALLRLASFDPAGFDRGSLMHPSLRARIEYVKSLSSG